VAVPSVKEDRRHHDANSTIVAKHGDKVNRSDVNTTGTARNHPRIRSLGTKQCTQDRTSN
jgi:hypothetical protein